MSNAAKHRKKAAEFEQLKQIDRAIASYIKSIEESETAGEEVDVAVFNKVGDLALRQGRVPDAITYYERAVEHYATSGLFNNAIALCNKILRSAPGRANVYFTLGRICARKGLKGDATRNFLEYATRMREENRVEEGMRALAEIADLSPELTEVRRLVDEYAQRAGITLPRRMTPPIPSQVVADNAPRPSREEKSQDLVFIQVDYETDEPAPLARHVRTPMRSRTPVRGRTPVAAAPAVDPLAAAILVPGPGLELLRSMATEAETVPVAAVLVEDLPEVISPVVDLPMIDTTVASTSVDEAAIDAIALDTLAVVPLDGLEANGDYDSGVATLEGLTVDEPTVEEAADVDASRLEGMPLVPSELEATAFGQVELMPDVVVEDFDQATDDPGVAAIIATETPLFVDIVVVDPTPITTEAIPELDEAIAEGEATAQAFMDAPVLDTPVLDTPTFDPAVLDAPPIEVARITPMMLDFDLEQVEDQAPDTRPPFRIDPHDFILPGELPPLLLDDTHVEAGLAAAVAPRGTPRSVTPVIAARIVTAPSVDAIADTALDIAVESPNVPLDLDDVTPDELAQLEDADGLLDVEADLAALATSSAPVDMGATVADSEAVDSEVVDATIDDAAQASHDDADRSDLNEVEEDDELPSAAEFDAAADNLAPATTTSATPLASRAVVPTPALPIAAVAAEATIVATSRRDALRAAVSRLPNNWMLRRRLAEALLESGEREEALTELETARQGFVDNGDLSSAADIGDEMVQVAPERVAYHQRRVELSVTMHDLQRLRVAYLDLADALVRLGEEGRARAVYARVLEIDPLDDRAREALGAAAPPPPPSSARPDDDFVDLTTWLKDDDGQGGDTRLRMREPVISGDEQADFDELLRHFKEGVARSLGEDDFESHYDLGVAYKEMGLLDDAIAEFQKALRSHGNRLPAYEALGQCFVEQGRHQVAATVLTRALHEPGLGDEQRVGVLYLLAFSCEALQRIDEARSYYQRVYATDIQFRDASARLAALEHISR